MAGSETTGAVTDKMDLGGMWRSRSLPGELFGRKFYGYGLDTCGAAKKTYVSVWVDSLGAGPVVTEGTYDPAGKTRTLAGERKK